MVMQEENHKSMMLGGKDRSGQPLHMPPWSIEHSTLWQRRLDASTVGGSDIMKVPVTR